MCSSLQPETVCLLEGKRHITTPHCCLQDAPPLRNCTTPGSALGEPWLWVTILLSLGVPSVSILDLCFLNVVVQKVGELLFLYIPGGELFKSEMFIGLMGSPQLFCSFLAWLHPPFPHGLGSRFLGQGGESSWNAAAAILASGTLLKELNLSSERIGRALPFVICPTLCAAASRGFAQGLAKTLQALQ